MPAGSREVGEDPLSLRRASAQLPPRLCSCAGDAERKPEPHFGRGGNPRRLSATQLIYNGFASSATKLLLFTMAEPLPLSRTRTLPTPRAPRSKSRTTPLSHSPTLPLSHSYNPAFSHARTWHSLLRCRGEALSMCDPEPPAELQIAKEQRGAKLHRATKRAERRQVHRGARDPEPPQPDSHKSRSKKHVLANPRSVDHRVLLLLGHRLLGRPAPPSLSQLLLSPELRYQIFNLSVSTLYSALVNDVY